MSAFFAGTGYVHNMQGTIAKSIYGHWQFILRCFDSDWCFPFEYGPSCDSELPGAGMLSVDEPAELAPRGTVLVKRNGAPRYAGRINIHRRVVRT